MARPGIRSVAPLVECFASRTPETLRWINVLDHVPESVDQVKGLALLYLGFVNRLDIITDERRKDIALYAQPWYQVPTKIEAKSLPCETVFREDPFEAAVLWVRFYHAFILADALAAIKARSVEVQDLITRLRHSLALLDYVSRQPATAVAQENAAVVQEYTLGAICLQILMAVSQKLAQTSEWDEWRLHSLYMAWKVLEWSKLAATVPLAVALLGDAHAIYYETLGAYCERKNLIQDAVWAYLQAKVKSDVVDILQRRLRNAGMSPLEPSMIPADALKITKSAPKIELYCSPNNFRAALATYLPSITPLIEPLQKEWFGAEFDGLQSASAGSRPPPSSHHSHSDQALDDDDNGLP